jgi:hypothetical protein
MRYKTGRNLFDVEKGHRPRSNIPGFEFVIGFYKVVASLFCCIKAAFLFIYTVLRLETCMPKHCGIT